MGLIVQFLQDELSSILEEIHRTTLLGTLVPQLSKFRVGVQAVNELMGMKRAGLVQQVIQGGIHGVQVHLFPFPHFTRRIGFQRTFVHHFFFIVFERLGCWLLVDVVYPLQQGFDGLVHWRRGGDQMTILPFQPFFRHWHVHLVMHVLLIHFQQLIKTGFPGGFFLHRFLGGGRQRLADLSHPLLGFYFFVFLLLATNSTSFASRGHGGRFSGLTFHDWLCGFPWLPSFLLYPIDPSLHQSRASEVRVPPPITAVGHEVIPSQESGVMLSSTNHGPAALV